MLLDIATGIIFSLIVSNLYSIDLTIQFLLLGIISNLLADLDAIIYFIKYKQTALTYNHRNLFHKPIIFFVLGLLIYVFFDKALGLLFAITTLAHFIHDSMGIGWGIQWLWPFRKDHYAFFYLYSPPYKRIPRKLFYCWKLEELPDIVREYGDRDWFKNIYFKFHPYAIVEYLTFLLAVLILILHWAIWS